MPPVTEIRHSSHPKCMLKLESPSIPYICDGCQELGFGMCYRCRKCKFYIHKECAILPPSSSYHHLFEGCRFEFYWNSPVSYYTVCDACGRDIKGFVYHCSKKRFDLHPQCAKLPLTLIGKDVILELKEKASFPCQKCRIKSSSNGGPKGWSYVSTCGRFCLHVACVKEMLYEAWEKSYFSEQGHDIYKKKSTIPSTSKGITEHRGRVSSLQGRSPTIDKGHRGGSSPRVLSPGTHGTRRDRGTSINKGHRGRSSSYVRSPSRTKRSPSRGRVPNTSIKEIVRHRESKPSSGYTRGSSLSGRRDRGTSRDKGHRRRSSSRVRSPGTHRSYSSSPTRRSSQGRVPSTTTKKIVRHGERKPSTLWKISRSILPIILSAIFGEPITFSTSLIYFLTQTISGFNS